MPEWFRFGYLGLGRRRTQGLLAPFHIAIVVEREYEASAHVIAVPASDEQFIRLPRGRRSAATVRPAIAA